MNLYLYTVDKWRSSAGKSSIEFCPLEEYRDALQTIKNVEADCWQSLISSRLYLVETEEEVDLAFDLDGLDANILDKVLLWEWERGEEE